MCNLDANVPSTHIPKPNGLCSAACFPPYGHALPIPCWLMPITKTKIRRGPDGQLLNLVLPRYGLSMTLNANSSHAMVEPQSEPTSSGTPAYGVPKPSRAPKKLDRAQSVWAVHNWAKIWRRLETHNEELTEAMITTMKILTHSEMMVLGDGGNFNGTATLEKAAARDPRFWTVIADFLVITRPIQRQWSDDGLATAYEDETDTAASSVSNASADAPGTTHPWTGTWRPSDHVGHDDSSSLASMVAHPEGETANPTNRSFWHCLNAEESSLTPEEAKWINDATKNLWHREPKPLTHAEAEWFNRTLNVAVNTRAPAMWTQTTSCSWAAPNQRGRPPYKDWGTGWWEPDRQSPWGQWHHW